MHRILGIPSNISKHLLVKKVVQPKYCITYEEAIQILRGFSCACVIVISTMITTFWHAIITLLYYVLFRYVNELQSHCGNRFLRTCVVIL